MGGRARGAQRRLPEARLKTACDRSGERVGPRAHAVLAATWESGRVGARMGARASAAQGEGARGRGRGAALWRGQGRRVRQGRAREREGGGATQGEVGAGRGRGRRRLGAVSGNATLKAHAVVEVDDLAHAGLLGLGLPFGLRLVVVVGGGYS